MNNLERYLDQVIEPKPAVYDAPVAIQEMQPPANLLESVRRRWYIVLGVTLLICAAVLPAIWFLVEPVYVVQGAVQIRAVVPDVLTGEPESGEVTNYGQFVNTEAIRLRNNPALLLKIVEDLAGRNLKFLRGEPSNRLETLLAKVIPGNRGLSPDQILRKAITDEKIIVRPFPNSELLAVTMRSTDTAEAAVIVNSFLRNYAAQYGVTRTSTGVEEMARLERHEKELRANVLAGRERISNMAEEWGTTDLDPLRQMELNRQASLLSELSRLESQRIRFDVDISVLEREPNIPISTEQILATRTAYVNSDPMVTELSTSIVQMERSLIAAQQTRTAANPAVTQSEAMLAAFKARLEERRRTLEEEFDANLQVRLEEAVNQRLAQARIQRAQIDAYIDEIRRALVEQEVKAQRVGVIDLGIRDEEYRVQLDQQTLEQVTRRLQLLEMRNDLDPRVQVAIPADVAEKQDQRPKYAGMTVFAALACGLGLAFLRDKTDKTLQTPTDVSRQLDLPILGTTTNSRTVKPALFAEQIASDYQTIRTNLGLLYNGGTPKKLVVSSAGMREGKTTFAVNLATSLAKAGKKVLLIDGDLRKPDIGHMLNILNNAGGLQNVLLGEDPSGIVCVLPSSGLHVLAANPRNLDDAYDLLTSSMAAEQIERLSRQYDHLIVDSPPALAFPDALVWAKLSDAVILVTYAGQTTGPDLKEAKERFTRVRTRILGAVLSNVPVDQGLYRYSYNYRTRGAQAVRKGARPKKLLLATPGQEDKDRPTGA
jgi:capsular exopolysaccharide synthesis family protein